MITSLRNYPSKISTRIILVTGLAIFIPAYGYIARLFSQMGIETAEFNTVWLSFDVNQFQIFVQKIIDQGQVHTFLLSYKINIISMSGFGCVFFALAIILTRTIPEESKLYNTATVFPVVAVLIATLDIFPSLFLIASATSFPHLSQWVVTTISGGYMVRVILLYILLLWFAVVGINRGKAFYNKVTKNTA